MSLQFAASFDDQYECQWQVTMAGYNQDQWIVWSFEIISVALFLFCYHHCVVGFSTLFPTTSYCCVSSTRVVELTYALF